MKRNLLASSFAVVVGIPLGWILTMISTPILWRLEPILHMELAGHSGPSDWVFYVAWAVVLPALFLLFRFCLFRSAPPKLPHS
jgi:ABC-type antimicrobial peptide transport system permease subunit